jgi:hypothetical protein
MRLIAIAAGLLILLGTQVGALELLTNGDFEQDLAENWTVEMAGSSTFAVRATSLDGDPDYEVLSQKGTGNGHVKVYQVIPIPSTDLNFTVTTKLQADISTLGPWAAAGMLIYYEDRLGNILGTTCIVWKTPDCPWEETDEFHIIEAPNQDWNDYSFSLEEELAHFPGLDREEVKQIRISLSAVVSGDC